jgi:hypothetical protein
MWLLTVLIAMIFIAGLTMGATYHGWCLGRQGVEQRVIVPAPAVTVDPAQIRVEVEPTTVQVSPPVIHVNVPQAQAPTIHIMEQTAKETKETKETKEIAKVAPITIAIPQPKPKDIKDIDEFGELLPPPKVVKP